MQVFKVVLGIPVSGTPYTDRSGAWGCFSIFQGRRYSGFRNPIYRPFGCMGLFFMFWAARSSGTGMGGGAGGPALLATRAGGFGRSAHFPRDGPVFKPAARLI